MNNPSKTQKKIAILPGDGIGPEVMESAIKVLRTAVKDFDSQFQLEYALVGGAAFDKYGVHFPDETKTVCQSSDAILFGSVGGPVAESHLPKWKGCEVNSILALRKTFGFSTNFRPVAIYPELADISPLKADRISNGVDILVLRELTGDVYFGEKGTNGTIDEQNRNAFDTGSYTEQQIKTVAHAAFKAARIRKKKVASVDKANVLEMSRLWRVVVAEVAKEYPDVELENVLVDNCAMQLVLKPSQFDVILTSNLFGDILSDLCAVLPGSLGLLASASLNKDGFGLFEPPGGSAPDIAGKGIANPVGQILSAAMMLRFAFNMDETAKKIESAVRNVLGSGVRTGDISGDKKPATTLEFTNAVCSRLS